MAKRIRTGKTSGAEVMELDGVMTPSLPSSPAAFTTASNSAMTRPRSGSASSTTMSTALTNGKGRVVNTAAAAPNAEPKHVMLPAFLSKTFEIFSMAEFASVCGWNASGDTIIVSHLEAFVATVLPRFFKHRNFPSFVRQLNLYGFHKTVLDSKRLEFQHPYFKRDRPDLLHYIKRKVSTTPPPAQQPTSSRLEVHREVSDQLLKEMKELRNRSETMEKRLRELEIDNAIVRSDNMKLWKNLESAKDKQLIMQEKMKKIMWILFQIYRGQGLPKLSGHNQETEAITEDYINSSRLGPKEFRDVLRFLAMDEPGLLPASVETPALQARKRKFVEVPSADASFGDELFNIGSSSVEEIGSPLRDAQPTMATSSTARLSANAAPTLDDGSNNILSIFSPQYPVVPRIAPQDRTSFSTNATTTRSRSSQAATTALADVSNARMSFPAPPPAMTTTLARTSSTDAMHAAVSGLDFIDDELPLLSDADNYPFSDAEEQHVMRKLDDFETSLLDEYDVGCLDTLLQQLKAGTAGKTSSNALMALDSEEISGSEDATQTSA